MNDKYKILLFTDSRGWHKPKGSKHLIYGEKLRKDDRLSVTAFYCPFKWTTILDFLLLKQSIDFNSFDKIILHAGIVDHSPRRVSNAYKDLYAPDSDKCNYSLDGVLNKTGSKDKIVNYKKEIFDETFGSQSMQTHFHNPFKINYEGENTINMYTEAMLEESLVPVLKKFKNLIFINSNRICNGWNGDYPRLRPENMDIIEGYSSILSKHVDTINLLQWDLKEVKKNTCDNLHLTSSGSEWIYNRILEQLGFSNKNYILCKRRYNWELENNPDNPFNVYKKNINTMVIDSVYNSSQGNEEYTRGKNIKASVVVGYRQCSDEPLVREENLHSVINAYLRLKSANIDIHIVEQDTEQKLNITPYQDKIKYHFLYNPHEYNRGWLYNVAAKHFVQQDIIIFADSDIIPGWGLNNAIEMCARDFIAVSPYRSIYYTSEKQRRSIIKSKVHDFKVNSTKTLSNPVSISGGIFIVRRNDFLQISGFEQYVGYGCEDRALDSTILGLWDKNKISIQNQIYVHLHHGKSGRSNFNEIYTHLVDNYGCEYYSNLKPGQFLHSMCIHKNPTDINRLNSDRKDLIGDPDLYSNNTKITVNGLPPTKAGPLFDVHLLNPHISSSNANYHDAENYLGKYAKAWKLKDSDIAPDKDRLQQFYGRYAGERCFIIGNGPSLNKHDLRLLQNEYSFGVNSLYYKSKETGFIPTFYVVEDSSVLKENINEIVKYEAPFKFFPSLYKNYHPKADNVYFFQMNRGFYEKNSPNFSIPRFSTDISQNIYCGQSVTYMNLQLAHYMGFTEIYLIGMDFSYIIPKSHKRKGDVLYSDTDDPNHFHKDYFGKGKTWKDPKLDRVLLNYKQANFVYECSGRKIYNATYGGELEVFERINYLSLFSSNVQSRKKLDLVVRSTKTRTKVHQVAVNVKTKSTVNPNKPVSNTILGPQRILNILNILRSLNLRVINGHLISFDNPIISEDMCIDLFSLKCIDILPNFKVKNLRIKRPNESILYASHRNLLRTDWPEGNTFHHDIKSCGFKFSNFQIKINHTYFIEYLDQSDNWHHLLEFQFVSIRGKIRIKLDQNSSNICDILDGFHASHLSLSCLNKWIPSGKFLFSGWAFLRVEKFIEQFRIVYQNGHIIPLLSSASPVGLNNYFKSIERFSFCGFTTISSKSIIPPGNASIQGYYNSSDRDKKWHDLLCIRIDHRLFSRFIRVMTI
jgi:hypothetical protein